MRVIVVDDALLTRAGLVRLLAEVGVDVVAQAADARDIQALVADHDPDVVVLDIRMPPTFTDEGLLAASALHRERPELGLLVLSQYLETEYAMRLIEEHPEGVGYLLKDRLFDIAVLVDALRRIAEGETVIDPTIVARLLGRRRRQDPVDRLTPREREVLALIAEGLSNQAIAQRLVVTERTVETHVTSIFMKLELADDATTHRRVQAVLRYLRHAV
ncbi:two component transcriptional regulator, LuxR family [Xylanimonas cellulosilytica DSM 15894]|uniref:Two component transcriptional regulator, LuxR family n=1 Tax=Xylanimonas cellulosilytica (strain DSM 15894 / JCM 12276 / CECT 5975 / KCTC 9989 / LMG 20990 / NBRC 107835 / XIL07) TaxID=446471 RepID=D1BUP2_XYLCX|nr:response regulator transcription factor [Xylanimonas cellulosilytica]ACZ29283.1 two component transcriptional regulator, LuxR family [Xylanimonas cellulosilytica DSM 15894]